jgi:hypothetical protein
MYNLALPPRLPQLQSDEKQHLALTSRHLFNLKRSILHRYYLRKILKLTYTPPSQTLTSQYNDKTF